MSEPFRYPEQPIDRGKRLTRGEAARARRVGPLQGRGRRRRSRTAPWRATGCPRTSAAARATTSAASTASGRPTTWRTSTGWTASSSTARALMPPPVVDRVEGARVGIIGYGTSHWGIAESRDQLRAGGGPRRRRTCGCGRIPFSRGRAGVRRGARPRLRGRAEPRRPDGRADHARHRSGAGDQAAAACGTTTACRSTRAPSPTRSSRRSGS